MLPAVEMPTLLVFLLISCAAVVGATTEQHAEQVTGNTMDPIEKYLFRNSMVATGW